MKIIKIDNIDEKEETKTSRFNVCKIQITYIFVYSTTPLQVTARIKTMSNKSKRFSVPTGISTHEFEK